MSSAPLIGCDLTPRSQPAKFLICEGRIFRGVMFCREAGRNNQSNVAMHDDSIRIDPPLYLAHTMISCWRCGGKMPALALIAPNLVDADGEICILSEIKELPKAVLQFVDARFPSFALRYSKTAGSRYYANTCPKCGVISGDFYLQSEPGAPFFPTNEEEAKHLTLEAIPLASSIRVRAGIAMGAGELILEHARKPMKAQPAATGSERPRSR